MNTTNNHNDHNNDAGTLLESLRYDSVFSNQKFEIDSKNNLHITELSALKNRNDVIPLDLINPLPTNKKRLNQPLMLLALASTLASSAFFASAVLMGQLWTVAFAIVFWVFGMATLIASYKNRITVYQYQLANTGTLLFSLSSPSTQNQQVELFIKALNIKIISLTEKSEHMEFNEEDDVQVDIDGEMAIYTQGKQSQYMKHLDFLFNHSIVDEVLYKRLYKKINKKISDSENRFISDDLDIFDDQTTTNNVIKFPVNA